MRPKAWRLEWAHGTADILEVGAILWSCRFRLPDGRDFAPFAAAAWAGDPAYAELPGHMQWLGGEFACLPFGVGGPICEPEAPWRSFLTGSANVPSHGFAANERWHLVAETAGALHLSLEYPSSSPIARVRRSILADPNAPALDLIFTVEARRACRMPIGLHPILSLDRPAEDLTLRADFDFGLTYPAVVAPDVMLAAPGREFGRLDEVPGKHGGTIDLTRLPKAAPAEDVVQLCGIHAPIVVGFSEARATLTIDWDSKILPSCLIWIGDRALKEAPWNGRFRGLGIEPIAAAFDFAEETSLADNPLAGRGIATAVEILPGAPCVIRYRVAASPSTDRDQT